jgi:predicted transposase YbfD/YdcC
MKIFALTIQHKAMRSQKGFILPFTMLISTLILLVSGSALTLLTKQLYFSKMYKQSQTAYYAADDAMTCAIDVDDTYSDADGLGIFPYSTTTDATAYINNVITYFNARQVLPALPITLDQIKCAQSDIFTGASAFAVATTTFMHTFSDGRIEDGKTSTYTMHMDLGPDPADTDPTNGISHLYRCAKITVNKTLSFRQIISQGYAQCDNPNGSIERAVVNTTESE